MANFLYMELQALFLLHFISQTILECREACVISQSILVCGAACVVSQTILVCGAACVIYDTWTSECYIPTWHVS